LEQKRQKAEYENKLQRYEQEFSSEIEAEYPLRQESVDWLKNLQQQLGLKDEDIERIDRPIRERAEAKYQEKLRQQAEAERQHQIELEQKRQKAEYEDKLQRYEKAFLGAVDTEYPLRQGIVEWLRNLQKQLGLNERDKRQIEAHVFDALAGSLRDQGKLDEAIAHHRRAIQMNPNHANAHHGLGLTLYHQGKLDESILAYRRAIQLDPKYAIAHNNLGLALYHQGQLEDAIAAYRKAVKLDPNCLDASNNLKAALQEQRQGKKFWGLF
jgi:tetratricopeptide (TPR) repeat protein